MAVEGAHETVTGEADASDDRPSRVVEIVEREAKPVAGAVEAGRGRDEDFEIEADLGPGVERNERTATVEAVRASGDHRDAIVPKGAGASVIAAKPLDVEEEAVIEVGDDEISSTEISSTEIESTDYSSRVSRPSISPESSLQRSRPPARPSLRPRPPFASSLLPPPSRVSLPAPLGSYPPGSLPAITEDPWQRANKALELSRALARIAELEELVAYREARMTTLQEKLDVAERKLAELGHGPISVRTAHAATSPKADAVASRASTPAAGASSAASASVARRSVPMPADRDRGLPRDQQQATRATSSPVNGAKPAASAKEITQTKMSAASPRAANVNTGATPLASTRGDKPVGASGPGVSPAQKAEVPAAAPVREAASGPEVAPVARAAAVPRAAVVSPAAAAPRAPGVVAVAPAATPVLPAVAPKAVVAGVPEVAVARPAPKAPARPEPAAKVPALATVTSTAPAEDDLGQIVGIGPRFEAALRKQGITRLSQIAAWSDADVRQVAKALKIPKSRIIKGRWVESAREAIGSRGASE